MVNRYLLAEMLLLNTLVGWAQTSVSAYNVQWTSQSLNSSGSMPMGTGDLGANLWVDQEGILQFYYFQNRCPF